jgi:hypothetical protein
MKSKTYATIFTIGVILRIVGLWIPSLWYDENFTLILARLPFDRMIAATMGDVHPPLWYIIEWLVYHPALGQSAWMIRIPALVCSIIALDVFRSVMESLHLSERVQTIAFTMMAILPFQLWYAQEGRMYSLLMLEVLLAFLFARHSRWMGLFMTAVAMLYTQNYAMIYLAVIGLDIFNRDLRNYYFANNASWSPTNYKPIQIIMPTIKAAAVLLSAFCFYLPWVKVLSQQMTEISGRYWIQEQRIGDGLNILYKLFWGSSTPSWALFLAIFTTLGLIALGVVVLASENRTNKKWTIFIMAFGPFVLAWIASIVWQPILLFRPLIGISPFLYVIVASALDRFIEAEQPSLRREPVLVTFLVIPLLVAGIGGYYRNIPSMKSDGAVSPLVSALDYVRAHWQDGDVIYYTDDGPMINLLPYAADLPQYMMAACGERMNVGPVLGSLSPTTRKAIGVEMIDLAELLDAGPYRRAWVFAPFSPLHPKCYEQQVEWMTSNDPVLVIDDNIFIYSGLWKVEK